MGYASFPPTIVDSLKQVALSLINHARTRMQLVLLEMEKEKARLSRILISAALGVFFGIFAFMLLTFGVIAYFWDTEYRVAVIFGLAAVSIVGAGGCWAMLRSLQRRNSTMFESTLAELRKDQEAMQEGLDETH